MVTIQNISRQNQIQIFELSKPSFFPTAVSPIPHAWSISYVQDLLEKCKRNTHIFTFRSFECCAYTHHSIMQPSLYSTPLVLLLKGSLTPWDVAKIISYFFLLSLWSIIILLKVHKQHQQQGLFNYIFLLIKLHFEKL